MTLQTQRVRSSKSVIFRLKLSLLWGQFEKHRAISRARWQKRDLSVKRYVYFWADGIHVQARLEDDA